MESVRGVRSLLFGIQVTIFGGVLVFASSGSAGEVGLVVAGVGFLVSLSGRWLTEGPDLASNADQPPGPLTASTKGVPK